MTEPIDPEVLLKQAQRHVRHKELAEAQALFDQVLVGDATNVPALEGLGAARFLAGDLPGAADAFKRITQIDFQNGKALINLGAVYNRMGEYSQAADCLRRGLAKDRKSAQGYYNLGIAQRHLGQKSLAVNAYREAVRLEPDMAEAHQNLANVYLEMGSVQQAVDGYKRALEINPDFERAQRGLEEALGAVEESKRAISPFGRLVNTERARVGSASVFVRNLTEQERLHDRLELQKLAVKVRAHGKAFLNFCRDELEPGLLALSRAVAQGTGNRYAITRAHEGFQTMMERAGVLRRQMRRSVLELMAHEELMNTPELGEPDGPAGQG